MTTNHTHFKGILAALENSTTSRSLFHYHENNHEAGKNADQKWIAVSVTNLEYSCNDQTGKENPKKNQKSLTRC